MPQQRSIGIRNRLQQSLRHRGAVLVEQRVHAGDHNIHLFQHGVREIERAIAQNVDFDPGKHANALHLLSNRANLLDVCQRAFIGEAVGERQIFRVIGDGHVFIAALPRRFRHLFNRVAAVGFNRVHVHVAANVG